MDNRLMYRNLSNLYDLFELWVKYRQIIKTSTKKGNKIKKTRNVDRRDKLIRTIQTETSPKEENGFTNRAEDVKVDEYNKVIRPKKTETKQTRKRKGNRFINKTRDLNGYYKVTFVKIKELDPDQFFLHTRMTPHVFDCLLTLIGHQLMKSSMRKPINPSCRLALTLLYLSQGESFQNLSSSWKLGKETVRAIIYETCDAIWDCLSLNYMNEPHVAELEKVEKDFNAMWNLPNCIGAIDAKHIILKQPSRSSSEFTSIVLIAACDANYTFTYVDIGSDGSEIDEGIFQLSSFGKRILENRLDIPPPKHLPNSEYVMPHFFVADAAFPLHTNLMKPFREDNLTREKEYFNERISRARGVIENSFGILTARWRVLLTTLNLFPKNAEKVVLACIALHNFLSLNEESKNLYLPSQYADWTDEDNNVHEGVWRSEIFKYLIPMAPSLNRHTYQRSTSINMRNQLCSYVNNEGYIQLKSTCFDF